MEEAAKCKKPRNESISQVFKGKEKKVRTEGKTGSPGGNLQAGINKNKEKEGKKERKKNKTLHLSRPKKTE